MPQPTVALVLPKRTPQSRATSLELSNPAQRDAWLAQKIATLQSLFNNAPLTQAANEIYLDELDVLLGEVGPDRLQQALRCCVRQCKFMPTIAEIRDAAGLNPAKLLAAETDLAWEFVVRYRQIKQEYISADYDSETPAYYTRRPSIPDRIQYAVDHCGGMEEIGCAIKEANTGFIRRRFDEAFARFVCSPKATDENLHPIRTLSDLEERLTPVRCDCPRDERFMAEIERHKNLRDKWRLRPSAPEQLAPWRGKTVNQSDPDSVPV